MKDEFDMNDQNTKQIDQNPVNQPIQIPEKPKINYWAMIVIILIGVILLVFGGYYLSKQLSKNTRLNQNQTTVSPTTTENDATTNWKTYTNKDYKFSFQYPSDWETAIDNNGFYGNISSKILNQPGPAATFFVKVFKDKTAQALRGENTDVWKKSSNNPNTFTFEIQNITINQRRAFQVVQYRDDLFAKESKFPFEKITIVDSTNSSTVYEIFEVPNVGPNEIAIGKRYYDTLDQILSTFKFDDQNTGDTTNWKTYSNSRYNFELKYPKEWEGPMKISGTNIQGQASFQGTEGAIILTWGGGFGGGLCSQKVQIIQTGMGDMGFCATHENDGSKTLKTANEGPVPQNAQYINVQFTVNPPVQENEQILNQIFSTFKFLGQDPNSKGKFCGGIAGNIPQNQCPSGYICKLDGNYPDAGGRCEKP